MTLIEKLKASNLLIDNDVRIDEAIFRKRIKKLNISFVLKKAVPINTYKELNKIVDNSIKELNEDFEYEFSFGYEDESLSSDEVKEYLV